MARRIPRLDSVNAIINELGYLYRSAWRDKLSWMDARSAAYVLKEIRAALVDSDFEARLSELERERGITRPPGSNGHAQTYVHPRHMRPS